MNYKTILLLAALAAVQGCGLSRSERNIINGQGPLMHVLTIGNEIENAVLRAQSADFSARDLKSEDFRTLVEKMISTVTDPSQDGVGIAAPQVGLNRRLIVVCRMDLPGEPYLPYANAYIESTWGDTLTVREGCLSIPGIRGNVPRPEFAAVRHTDPETLEVKVDTVSGYVARIFQHEVDHLDGILYTDRTNDTWTVPGD
ncbi:MAG: peptide deformylase [Bacteroidales bacterium]|nr:peptide deformylase [Bacteroidales bacterium]